ncbi:MAG: hypothetical protein AAB536_02150 [Patescibacteria group bacterium]
MDGKQADMKKWEIGNKTAGIVPPIDDYSSRRRWEEESWRKISESRELLPIILTSYERRNLVIRAAILEGLSLGKGQRQLSRELSVSLQTINAVKKAIAENSYRSYFERSKKDRKKKKYSAKSASAKTRRRGASVRTKYGIIHMPR